MATVLKVSTPKPLNRMGGDPMLLEWRYLTLTATHTGVGLVDQDNEVVEVDVIQHVEDEVDVMEYLED